MTISASILGGPVQLTGNPVYINCTGSFIPTGAYEYMITLKILSPDTKLEGAPFNIASTPDTNGEVLFNISGILDQPLALSVQYPIETEYVEYPLRPFNIQVQPGERYINSSGLLVENSFAISEVFQMVKGGLSPRQNAMMKADNATYYSTYMEGHKFLTPRPWGDYVHPTQPVKLWFMSTENITLDFRIKVYYDDTTDLTINSSIDFFSNSLYELNCNPKDHFLQMELPTKKILYFDVSLMNGSTSYSDTRRFEVDWIYCERPYFMFFANSLGGIDDVYFSGFGIDAFNVKGTLSYRPVQPEDTVFTPTIVSPNKTAQNAWKINTGWKHLTILQFYRDLMVSKQAWFLYPGLSGLTFNIIPVNVMNTDTELINRQDDQWNVDIELVEAHSTRFSFDNRLY